MDFTAGKSNSNRGMKRQRPPNEDDGKTSSRNEDNTDEIDVPLSKKINRLNIDYSSSDTFQNSFKDKYPYNAESTYYQSNELLYSLHEERRLRDQQSALKNALNSNLKL